jgi:type VI protein secretion system component VasF
VQTADRTSTQLTTDPSGSGRTVRVTMNDPAQLRVSNQELATVREAMRELGRLLDQLDEGELEKIVLTQRNQMRAVLITVERYSALERGAA